jgi:hypothetical protein
MAPLQHWARTLLDLKAAVPSLRWHVHLDDDDLVDEALRQPAG